MIIGSLVKVEAIKKVSEFVAQLRRVGKGHGIPLTLFIISTPYKYCYCID